MSSFNDILLFLHGLNRWLALLVGIWTLGLVLQGVTGRRVFTSIERRSVTFFTGALVLQVLLGLLLLGVMDLRHVPAFSGRSAVQWGHIGGGLLAVVFGILAFVMSRKAPLDRNKYRFAAVWSGLALLLLGKTLFMAALLGLLLLIRFIVTKLRNQRATRPGDSGPVNQRPE